MTGIIAVSWSTSSESYQKMIDSSKDASQATKPMIFTKTNGWSKPSKRSYDYPPGN